MQIAPTDNNSPHANGTARSNLRGSLVDSIIEYAGNLNHSLSGLRARFPESVSETELMFYNFRRGIVWASWLLVYLAYKEGFHFLVVSIVSEEIREKENFKLVELCLTIRSFYEIVAIAYYFCLNPKNGPPKILITTIPAWIFECMFKALYLSVRGLDHHSVEIFVVFIWVSYVLAFILSFTIRLFVFPHLIPETQKEFVTVSFIVRFFVILTALVHAVPCCLIVGYQFATNSLKVKILFGCAQSQLLIQL